jgi:hypothetical protein
MFRPLEERQLADRAMDGDCESTASVWHPAQMQRRLGRVQFPDDGSFGGEAGPHSLSDGLRS